MAMKPLENVRILDLSRMVAGGFAGMLLADFGADVVKLEQPGVGDPLRQWTTSGEPLWWRVYARDSIGPRCSRPIRGSSSCESRAGGRPGQPAGDRVPAR